MKNRTVIAIQIILFAAVAALPSFALEKAETDGSAQQATVSVSVENKGGAGIADAVVYLEPTDGEVPPAAEGTSAVMDQIDKQFAPRVLPVQAGTLVEFPNKDNILHHVYSFSPAKQFELPLYKEDSARPVLFDNPGVVVLGCNIHDWMIGYIVVVESPWFAKTGESGAAGISGVPPGEYSAVLWHPEAAGGLDPEKSLAAGIKKNIVVTHGGENMIEFTVEVKSKNKKKRAPSPPGGLGY